MCCRRLRAGYRREQGNESNGRRPQQGLSAAVHDRAGGIERVSLNWRRSLGRHSGARAQRGSPESITTRLGLWIPGSRLIRLRHKLLKASNDEAFERRGDGRFCWNSAYTLSLRLVCDAVVLTARP